MSSEDIFLAITGKRNETVAVFLANLQALSQRFRKRIRVFIRSPVYFYQQTIIQRSRIFHLESRRNRKCPSMIDQSDQSNDEISFRDTSEPNGHSELSGLIVNTLERDYRLRQQRGLFPTLPTRLGKKPIAIVTEIRWSTLTVKTVTLYPFDNIHVSDEK
ncbi:hypothetical protein HN011_007746 [Eciton burchellii]|nr:hypothetical protein HN011_007746 [Eciton burchellii]